MEFLDNQGVVEKDNVLEGVCEYYKSEGKDYLCLRRADVVTGGEYICKGDCENCKYNSTKGLWITERLAKQTANKLINKGLVSDNELEQDFAMRMQEMQDPNYKSDINVCMSHDGLEAQGYEFVEGQNAKIKKVRDLQDKVKRLERYMGRSS